MMEDKKNLPELPKGWVWTKLGDVIEFVKGKKPKNLGEKSELLTIPYINIKAFEKKIFNQFTDGNDCQICESKDILIVWDGARCGLVGKGVAGAIGSTLAKLNCYEINSDYLFYFLRTKYEYINKRPKGVGIPHVEPNLFWNIHFPLPPLPEQHRIVARIEELFTKLDAGIDALKKVKAQLKRYRQAVLKYAFEGKLTEKWRKEHKGELESASILLEKIKEEKKKKSGKKYKELPPVDVEKLAELPDGWVWTRLGEICNTTSGGTPLRSKKEYYGGSIPWLKSGELKDNLIYQSEESITELGLANSSAKIFSKGTLLIALYGATVGKVGKLGIDATTNQAICGIFNKYGAFEEDYLFNYLISYRDNLLKNRFGGAQPNISQEIVRNILIPLPPLPEQHKIVEEIERRFSVADEVEKTVERSLKKVERLRQSILKKAFEGKLVPQDPTDEPADVLLERIKKEKEKLERERKSKRKNRRIKKRKSVKQKG